MNKPKIWATCKAGCLWQTVHYSDFLASGGLVPLNEDGDHKFHLTDATLPVNSYIDCDLHFKIYDASEARFYGEDSNGTWFMKLGFVLRKNTEIIEERYFLDIPARAEFEHNLTLDIHNIESGYIDGKFTLIYSVQGQRKTYNKDITLESTDKLYLDLFVENIGYTDNPERMQGYENSAVYLIGAGKGEGLNITVEDAVTDEQVAAAVADYLSKNPIGSASELTDTATGTKYSLSIVDGKLTLTPITQ